MPDRKGFTLIEVIFTISVLLLLSLFTLHFGLSASIYVPIDQQCKMIIALLEEAKTKALLHHEQVNILIDKKQISYDGSSGGMLTLDENYYFENSFELYFNKNGNVSSGNHLNLCNYNECRSIIFNVGSGAFYVKK